MWVSGASREGCLRAFSFMPPPVPHLCNQIPVALAVASSSPWLSEKPGALVPTTWFHRQHWLIGSHLALGVGVSNGKLKHSALSPVTSLTKHVLDSRSGGSRNVWTKTVSVQEPVKRPALALMCGVNGAPQLIFGSRHLQGRTRLRS